MTKQKKDQFASIDFVTVEKVDGMCGPEGCSIADHQKKLAQQQKDDRSHHE